MMENTNENDMLEECKKRLKRMNIEIPVIKHTSINRKLATCTRYLEKLFIRGEHIAIINLDIDTKDQSVSNL